MKNLIDSIQEAVVKLENGSLNQLELEALTVDARELYERLVVLRYKAYEQRIHNGIESAENVKVSGNELAEVDLVTDEHHTAPVAPAGGFDFEIFEEEPALFDKEEIPNFASQEPIVELVPEINAAIETPQVENTTEEIPTVESVTEKVSEPLFAENPFDLIEPSVEEHFSSNTSIIEIDDSPFEQVTESYEAKSETQSSSVFFQETITTLTPQQTKQEVATFTGEQHPMTSRINKSIQAVRSNYTIVPLDTLKGSFSLNEKLHYINDLFGGVSEEFTNAINKLDVIGNMTNATQFLAELAEKQGWDFENETTEEFIAKVCRRHAASLA